MSYSVRFAAGARRELGKLDPSVRRRVAGAVELLALNPRPPGAKQLRGGANVRWRVRVGDYRIVYAVEDSELIVLVLRLGHRREVYRD
ncbi:MAG: type II toxin-antitoxin system RelE family toxin [Candidatus Nanopelagicales bacterium]